MITPSWDAIPWNTYCSHQETEVDPSLTPGRVISQEGPVFETVTPNGLTRAEISGRLRYLVDMGSAEYPAVGDYVALQGDGSGLIDHVLPRQTVYKRRESGPLSQAQIICANIQVAAIMTTAPPSAAREAIDPGEESSLADFNVRRVERYIATLDPEVRPVVILNKIDLVEDPVAVLKSVQAELPGTRVVTVSALTGEGVDTLTANFNPGDTVALVGSSGCGKSTLVAQLTGQQIETGAVREADGRGRHTTTTRRMYLLPGGALLVDTPGMREVQLWSDGDSADDPLAAAFPEIAEFEGACKFRDCLHEQEPGCAVRAAVRDGHITHDRFLSYLQLRDEADRGRRSAEKRQRLKDRRVAKQARMRRGTRGG